MNPIPGLHHVTALASDPQQNLDFYAGRLGLRLVKRTVNFDDPATYHLYYGDDAGHPGTILTFFPWPGAPRGRAGTGQTTATSFAVPPASIEWWMDFLARHAIDFGPPELRFGARTLPFLDPDGLALELVELAEPPDPTRRAASAIPPQHAIHGFHGVTLTVSGFERTAAVLTESLGYRATEVEGDRRRFVSATATPDAVVDVICAPELRAG
ncbi:MAG: ring-cleaving dioxygenase, partial [Candidatus Eisenbacteria bacterium]|nr:ring-cleaving dioxygenase [Candidatus Eisenbacteria bacterium]